MRPFLAGFIVVAMMLIAILYLYDPALLHAWTHRLLVAN